MLFHENMELKWFKLWEAKVFIIKIRFHFYSSIHTFFMKLSLIKICIPYKWLDVDSRSSDLILWISLKDHQWKLIKFTHPPIYVSLIRLPKCFEALENQYCLCITLKQNCVLFQSIIGLFLFAGLMRKNLDKNCMCTNTYTGIY